MPNYIAEVVALLISLLVFSLLLATYFYYKRQKLLSKIRPIPPPSELRKRRIPVVESTPFYIPGRRGKKTDIEIQPSVRSLGPRASTPIPRRKKQMTTATDDKPQLKFSIKYNTKRSSLLVDLIDSKNLSYANLAMHRSAAIESFGNLSSVFTSLELSPRTTRPRAMENLPERRKSSFEFEMSYEDIQLQSLQFSVMGYDEYSRHKVIGDVILPMAELTAQGVDITRELFLWREIQTREMGTKVQPLGDVTDLSGEGPSMSASRCSPS